MPVASKITTLREHLFAKPHGRGKEFKYFPVRSNTNEDNEQERYLNATRCLSASVNINVL